MTLGAADGIDAVTITTRLQNAARLFLDTAPLIYYVEQNPRYLPLVEPIFDLLDSAQLVAVTSPITLAECLVFPSRSGRSDLAEKFTELIADNSVFVPIDETIAKLAADLRAAHNLALADSFQAAVALEAKCDVLLTNDDVFKRVGGYDAIVLDDFLTG